MQCPVLHRQPRLGRAQGLALGHTLGMAFLAALRQALGQTFLEGLLAQLRHGLRVHLGCLGIGWVWGLWRCCCIAGFKAVGSCIGLGHVAIGGHII